MKLAFSYWRINSEFNLQKKNMKRFKWSLITVTSVRPLTVTKIEHLRWPLDFFWNKKDSYIILKWVFCIKMFWQQHCLLLFLSRKFACSSYHKIWIIIQNVKLLKARFELWPFHNLVCYYMAIIASLEAIATAIFIRR